MKNTIGYLLKQYAFWFVFFCLAKMIFLLFNAQQSSVLSFPDLGGIFLYGLKLDLSMSGYFTMFMMLLFLIGILLKIALWPRIMFITQMILVVVALVIVLADARLYRYWGFKLDLTAFRFLTDPKDAAASIQAFDVVSVLIGFIIIMVICIKGYQWLFKNISIPKLSIKTLLTTLLGMGVLVLPIRGGVDVATVGLSSAYFSSNNFANHAATNTTWNLMYAYFNRSNIEVNFPEITNEERQEIMDKLYPKDKRLNAPIALKKDVNVVLIVLESFSKGLVESIGGAPGVTPNLNKAAKNGWNFTNFYASGDRSDKGLASLFTGSPGLPEASVLRFPDKLENIPHMYNQFNLSGYETSIIYGGNLDFANLRALFTTVKDCEIIDKSKIPTNDQTQTGKWGIHDQHTFAFLSEYVSQRKQPFFTTLYTLSSHEPFDVPSKNQKFTGANAKSYTAAAYTDSCLGSFLDRFSTTSQWNNTLVIITADHGIRQPGNIDVFHPDKFQIPLIFTGGVISSSKTFPQFKSHTDLPFTLQWWLLNHQEKNMHFSASLFDTTMTFANFFYQVGTGMINSNGCVVYDYLGKKQLYQSVLDPKFSEILENQTKSYFKTASDKFAQKP